MTTYRVFVTYQGATSYDIDAPDPVAAEACYWDWIRDTDRLRPDLCAVENVTVKEAP
jgi:hypothetical protein